jgi:hypothetical protein
VSQAVKIGCLIWVSGTEKIFGKYFLWGKKQFFLGQKI